MRARGGRSSEFHPRFTNGHSGLLQRSVTLISDDGRRRKDVHHAASASQRSSVEDAVRVYPRLRCLDGSGREGLRDLRLVSETVWLMIDGRQSANPSPAGRAANESVALREATERIKRSTSRKTRSCAARLPTSQADLPGD